MNLNMYPVRKIVNCFGMLQGFVPRCISFCVKICGDVRFMVNVTGKVRRFFLVTFNKSYVQRQLFYREGECNQCGVCCSLLFVCPSVMKDGRCRTYGVCRPQACKAFPIDQRDLDEVKMCGGRCGYVFCKAEETNAMSLIEFHTNSPR